MKPSIAPQSRLVLVLFLLALLASACSPSSPPQPLPENKPAPARPTQKPARPTQKPAQPDPGPDLPQSPVDIQDYTSGSGQTNAQGTASFADHLSGQVLELTVADRSNRRPIEGVSISFISNGPEVLVIAQDPSGTYAPSIRQYRYSELGFDQNPSGARLAAPRKISLAAVLLLIAIVEIEQNIKDWWAFAQDTPDLERWGFFSQDYCVTNDQAAKALKAATGAVLILLPPFASAFPKYADDILVSFLTALGDMAAGDLIDEQIERLGLVLRPAIARWRVYSINGVGLFAARPTGWCLEPLDRANGQEILNWVRYGLEKRDDYPFQALAPAQKINYVYYIEGGQSKTPSQYLFDVQSRLESGPNCTGVLNADGYLQIWTDGWTPKWLINQMCYAGCEPLDPPHKSSSAAFFFRPEAGEFVLQALWVDEFAGSFWQEAYGYKLSSCYTPYSSSPSQPASQTGAPDSNTSPTAAPAAEGCPGAQPSRLSVGEFAYISTDPPLPNRLRQGPGKSNDVIGNIQPGEQLSILSGPQCANDWAWWKVEVIATGQVGWTAEGDDQDYWLVPCASLDRCP